MPLFNPVVSRSLEIREIDGTPDVSDVQIIEVTNGTLTDDGGGQVTIVTGGGGGGNVTVIDDVTLAMDGIFDFTSISGSYTHLQLICMVRSDRTATIDNALMKLNNDGTDGNYFNAYQYFGTAATQVGGNNRIMGFIPDASSPANYYGQFIIDLLFYATGQKKVMLSRGHGPTDADTGYTFNIGGLWGNTAAIDQVTLEPDIGTNFLAGSRVQLLGITL